MKRAGESADAALQADGLFALFFQLEIEIDGAFFCVALDLDGFVFFDAIEVVELIEAKDADFPGALVEELAFVEQQFAADDFVARGGVAAEVDAADVVLLFFEKRSVRLMVAFGSSMSNSGSAVKSMNPYWP